MKSLVIAASLAVLATSAFAQPVPAHGTTPSGVDAPIKGAQAPVLTREQFLRDQATRFDTMDLNKDGKLTFEERRAFWTQRPSDTPKPGARPGETPVPKEQPKH